MNYTTIKELAFNRGIKNLIYVASIVLVLVGCISHNINMSSGKGTHDLGPNKESGWQSSKDSQTSSDSIKELSSKISGVDKSQNEIKRTIEKTSETQQDMEERNEAIDRLNPRLPKQQRKKIYEPRK